MIVSRGTGALTEDKISTEGVGRGFEGRPQRKSSNDSGNSGSIITTTTTSSKPNEAATRRFLKYKALVDFLKSDYNRGVQQEYILSQQRAKAQPTINALNGITGGATETAQVRNNALYGNAVTQLRMNLANNLIEPMAGMEAARAAMNSGGSRKTTSVISAEDYIRQLSAQGYSNEEIYQKLSEQGLADSSASTVKRW